MLIWLYAGHFYNYAENVFSGNEEEEEEGVSPKTKSLSKRLALLHPFVWD